MVACYVPTAGRPSDTGSGSEFDLKLKIMHRRMNAFLVSAAGILGIFCLIGQQLAKHKEMKRNKVFENRGIHDVIHDAADNRQVLQANAENDNECGLYGSVEVRMAKRRESMHSACAKYGLNQTMSSEQIYVKNPFLKTSLFYSDKHKLLLCQIPKCGSRNQAIFLATMEGLVTVEQSASMSEAHATSLVEKKLSARRITNINEISERIGTYRKLVIVREPFSRLLSAFRNKLYNNTRGDGYAAMAQKLHETFGGENVKQGMEVTKGVAPGITLNDFIMHLTDPKRNAQHDQHWNFFNRLCAPCLLDYDFIGHMETLNEDITYVKKKLGIEGVPFPASYNSFTDWEKVKSYFSAASPTLVNALYHTYKMDYEIFGYAPPPQF